MQRYLLHTQKHMCTQMLEMGGESMCMLQEMYSRFSLTGTQGLLAASSQLSQAFGP